jgi:membrane protein required for colicin V production
MTGFDVVVLAVVFVSTLLAFAAGVIRELISLAAWIVGIVAAVVYSGDVAAAFSRLDMTPAARDVLAFALILIAVLIAGAIVARLLRGAVHAVGLGSLDRLLGAVFGLARGLAVVIAFVLIAGLTTMPRQAWWQNSLLGAPLGEAALSLRPYLPPRWAARLDYSPAGMPPSRPAATTAV